MPDLLIAEELRARLVAAALVRLPGTIGTAPVCKVPERYREGTTEPSPDDVVVELVPGARVPGRHRFRDYYIEERLVDVKVRARFPADGELLQRKIANLLLSADRDVANAATIFFGALRIESVRLFRGDQPTGQAGGYQERTQTFSIAARIKSLAGEPYAP